MRDYDEEDEQYAQDGYSSDSDGKKEEATDTEPRDSNLQSVDMEMSD